MGSTELESATRRDIVTHVDTAEVPSAAWGWSGESRRTYRIAALVVAFILVAMTIGNHKGHIEDIFLVGFALAIVGLVVRDSLLQRKPH